jgi:hypothetical protein
MGCDNCPDDKTLEGVFFIVYAGGPPTAQYATMQHIVDHTQPNEIIRLYRPTIHSDGRIEYEKDAPAPQVPEGYLRDESVPWILRPIWPSCIYRIFRVQMLDDGQLKIEGLCSNPLTGIPANKPITREKCSLCVIGCAIGSMPIITDKIDALINLDGLPAS